MTREDRVGDPEHDSAFSVGWEYASSGKPVKENPFYSKQKMRWFEEGHRAYFEMKIKQEKKEKENAE